MAEKRIKKILIPFLGTEIPTKAEDKALQLMSNGGTIYLLNISDEGPKKTVRYMTGLLGENSDLVKNFEESRKRLHEKTAKEHEEELEGEAEEHSVSVELLFTSGDPAEEVLKAIEEYSIQVVVVEKLREGITGIFHGDELDYLIDNAPCRVLTV